VGGGKVLGSFAGTGGLTLTLRRGKGGKREKGRYPPAGKKKKRSGLVKKKEKSN